MQIWIGPMRLEDVKPLVEVGMLKHIGIELLAIGEDWLKGRMPVDDRTRQPAGILHGGATCALGESLASIASSMCVDLATHRVVGTEISASHIRSAREGYVYGVCRPLHVGRRSHVWDVRITDQEGKMVSVVRMTATVLNY
ncbi:MAG: hotdog fold thioesterase [Desulfobacterales bacterium]|nr:hotdog fold thioesterase [Desulfobacterales bacterium]